MLKIFYQNSIIVADTHVYVKVSSVPAMHVRCPSTSIRNRKR